MYHRPHTRCGGRNLQNRGAARKDDEISVFCERKNRSTTPAFQPLHNRDMRVFHRQHVRFSMKSEIQQSFDTDLTRQDVQDLSSADAVTAFFARLGYHTGTRTPQPLAISELPQTARPRPIKKIELIANHKRACFRSTCSSFRALRSGTRERWRERFGIAREIICWP